MQDPVSEDFSAETSSSEMHVHFSKQAGLETKDNNYYDNPSAQKGGRVTLAL